MLSPESLTQGPTVMRLVTGHNAGDPTRQRSASEHELSAGLPDGSNRSCELRARSV